MLWALAFLKPPREGRNVFEFAGAFDGRVARQNLLDQMLIPNAVAPGRKSGRASGIPRRFCFQETPA